MEVFRAYSSCVWKIWSLLYTSILLRISSIRNQNDDVSNIVISCHQWISSLMLYFPPLWSALSALASHSNQFWQVYCEHFCWDMSFEGFYYCSSVLIPLFFASIYLKIMYYTSLNFRSNWLYFVSIFAITVFAIVL